jgi:hypothetical protein
VNNWTWSRAALEDVAAIVELSNQQFGTELTDIYQLDLNHGACELAQAVIRQHYYPTTELVMVAKQADQVIAWMWVERNQYTPWSRDEVASVKMLHLNLSLPVRTRVALINESIDLWEVWAGVCGIPVVCSSTVRKEQAGFLRLHARKGYTLHGNLAFKRLNKED